MRKDPLVIGQYYHVYNRGTDKRVIFMDKFDLWRFLQSMEEFNTLDPIGSIYENRFNKNQLGHPVSKLVDIVCYSLNPNHYHFILSPLVENGIEKFMHKLGMGYAKYFNEKYDRTGVLFQGRYKSIHIGTDEYLMYLSAYINLNNKIHFLSHPDSKIDKEKLFYTSSWKEYIGEKKTNFCNKSIILDRFDGKIKEYEEFAESVAEGIIERRIDDNFGLRSDLMIEEIF
ncbi:transposase [Patescibacteria group bacterium]|nr:transposase [Patescibacteria group bacterium]